MTERRRGLTAGGTVVADGPAESIASRLTGAVSDAAPNGSRSARAGRRTLAETPKPAADIRSRVRARADGEVAPARPGAVGVRALIVDDYRLYREALAMQLALHPGLDVLGGVGFEECLLEARRLRPEVVVLSAVQSEAVAVQLIGRIRSMSEATRVLVLVTETSSWAAVQAVNAGASGFVLQGETVEGLARAVRAVATGQIVCPSTVTALLFSHVAGGVPVVHANGAPRLTGRQLEVISLIGQGMTNKEIARRLSLSLHTVKNHIHNLLERLGLRSRVEVALFARRSGILTREPDEAVEPAA